LLSQMTVSETMATIDVKMSMEKNSFQSMTAQTDRVVSPPQTPKILDTLVGGAIEFPTSPRV
jgi:hypothetical protein